jgi:predicted DNA-binding transcriptional regulator
MPFGANGMSGSISGHLRNFSAELTRGLGMPKASARIIEVVALRGRKLSFCEIAERVRMSDRSLRSHLGILVKRGILLREVAVTRTRRLAYRYYMAPVGEILLMVRTELAGRIEQLERLSREVRGSRRPAAI